MSKKNIKTVEVDKNTFKRLKKNKQRVVLQVNDENAKEINIKDKIIFNNNESNKKIKKKVKKIHKYSSIKEAFDTLDKKALGYRRKDNNPNYEEIETNLSKDNVRNHGVLGIEVKIKQHIVLKSFLVLALVILIFFGYYFANKKLEQAKSRKIGSEVTEIKKDKVDYVFVEINPSFVLTIKDGSVEDVACLNDDCIAIYSEIDVKGQDINSSIDSLYSLSSIKGYDISGGVKVKTTGDVSIEDKDYITFEYITEDTKDELLTSLKNNDSIKENNNDNYYATLWDKLKTDSDYGEVYFCNMDKEELKCNFTEKFILSFLVDQEQLALNYLGWKQQVNRYYNTLDKFDVNHKMIDGLDYILINNKEYYPVSGVVRNGELIISNVLLRETMYEGQKSFSISTYNECIQIRSEEYIELKDFNLLNPNNAKVQTYIPQDIVDECAHFPR